MSKFFVTTPIYYVNAKPHIGHVYSAIAADVLARYHHAKGDKVLMSTGVDENSQKNVEAAKKQGKEVLAYVDEMADVWKDTFTKLGFFDNSYTKFVRTTIPEHKAAVEALIEKIEKAGLIYLGDYVGFYCVGCEEFKAEKDLVDGKCPIHKTEPQQIKEKNYFFKLSEFKDQLLQHYAKHPEFVQPASARNKMLYYIEHELSDISISRQAQEWGIRMPSDPTHAVYVWVDALINYLTVTGYPDAEKSKEFWPADVHIIGKDIIKFHCAIWPAMLLAAGFTEQELPHTIFAHGFFTIDGQKISKSLGNAVDPLDLLKEYPFDAIRYYLLREIPFGNDGDFSHERLKERYNSDLANGLGNLVSRTLNMIEKFWPEYDGKGSISEQNMVPLKDESDFAITSLERFHFDKSLYSIGKLVSWADEMIQINQPWKLAAAGETEKLRVVLVDLFKIIEKINVLIAPLLPETHEKLTKILEARPLKKPAEPLFARK